MCRSLPHRNRQRSDAGFFPRDVEVLNDGLIARREETGAFVPEDRGAEAAGALGGVGFIEKRGRGDGGWRSGGVQRAGNE